MGKLPAGGVKRFSQRAALSPDEPPKPMLCSAVPSSRMKDIGSSGRTYFAPLAPLGAELLSLEVALGEIFEKLEPGATAGPFTLKVMGTHVLVADATAVAVRVAVEAGGV